MPTSTVQEEGTLSRADPNSEDCFYRKTETVSTGRQRTVSTGSQRTVSTGKFEKREAKGEIGRDASQGSHQGHQRQGEIGCSEDEQHFQ